MDVQPAPSPVTVLGIVGSPRRGNTALLIDKALQGAREVPGVKTEVFEFFGKQFLGCVATCRAYCKEHGRCKLDDDFHSFMAAWLAADGIVFAAPVFHMGPPGQVKAAIDRLGNVLSSYLSEGRPRYCKPSGAIVPGGTLWGGHEITLQFLLEHFVLMRCLPVAGDSPDSYIGVAGLARPSVEYDSIMRDAAALRGAQALGRRVAEMTRIVKAGMAALGEELPEEYHVARMLAKGKWGAPPGLPLADRPTVPQAAQARPDKNAAT